VSYTTTAIPIVVAVVTLVYASYRDVISREIPEVVWVPAYTVSVGYLLLSGFPNVTPVKVVLALLPPLTYLLLFLLNTIGGADLLATILISLTHLDKPLIPLATFVLSSLAPLPLILTNVILNLTKYSGIFKELKCVRGSRRALYVVGKPIRVSDFVKKNFVFLHTIPTDGGLICSPRAEADVDFEGQRRIILEAIKGGYLREYDYVVYSPAIPHVVLLTLSYVTVLAVYQLVENLLPLLP
jgi:Flp pilus assembly protein protease CpaA